jgi:hypothetical protein
MKMNYRKDIYEKVKFMLKNNLEYIKTMAKKYPNAILVLAHAA